MSNTISDNQSDLATSDDGEDLEEQDDADNNTELGKLSEDDKPGWVMGTIATRV